MGQTGYSGTTYSTYEASKLASRGISAFTGLAALIGSVYSGVAHDAEPVAYKDTNTGHYRVQSVDGFEPYRTRRVDLTNRISTQDTKADFYKMNDGFIAGLSIEEKSVLVMRDYDGPRSVDNTYGERNGDAQFSNYNAEAKIDNLVCVLK